MHGLSELTVSIRTIDDELTEETETFVLVLSVVDGPAVTGWLLWIVLRCRLWTMMKPQ